MYTRHLQPLAAAGPSYDSQWPDQDSRQLPPNQPRRPVGRLFLFPNFGHLSKIPQKSHTMLEIQGGLNLARCSAGWIPLHKHVRLANSWASYSGILAGILPWIFPPILPPFPRSENRKNRYRLTSWEEETRPVFALVNSLLNLATPRRPVDDKGVWV